MLLSCDAAATSAAHASSHRSCTPAGRATPHSTWHFTSQGRTAQPRSNSAVVGPEKGVPSNSSRRAAHTDSSSPIP
eukprot:301726-Chlamydomonas_euryale.AAC.1